MALPKKSAKEDGRLIYLEALGIVQTPAEAEFDELVEIAAELLGVESALLSFVDENQQWYKAKFNFVGEGRPRCDSICAYVVESGETLFLPDARKDPRFSSHPMVVGQPHLGFYLGVPLKTDESYVLGTLCALDSDPKQLRPAQLRMFEALARVVIDKLRSRLVDSERKGVISQLAHDLKSPLHAMLSSVHLLKRSELQEEVRAKIADSAERAGFKVNGYLDQILAYSLLPVSRLGGESEVLSVVESVRTVVDLCRGFAGTRGVRVEWDEESPQAQIQVHRERFERVLSSVIFNSVESSPDLSRIRCRCRLEAGQVLIEIDSAGEALPPDLSPEELRVGFRSQSMAEILPRQLGLYLAAIYLRADGGRLQYTTYTKGSRFTLELPLRPGRVE